MSKEKSGESQVPKSKPKRQTPPARKRASRPADIGRALRSVYDETLREQVPDDFEDLLRKLS